MTQGGNLFCSHRFLTANAGPLAASCFGTGGLIYNFPFPCFVAKGIHRFRIQHFHAANAGPLAASCFGTGGLIHNFPFSCFVAKGIHRFRIQHFHAADAFLLTASLFCTGWFIYNFPLSRFVAKSVHGFRIQHFLAADAFLLTASLFCTGGFIHNFPFPFDMLHRHFTRRCQLFIHAADCRNLCGSCFVPCGHSSIFIHSGHLFIGSCPHHTLFFRGIRGKVGNTQNSAFSVVQGKVFLIQLNFRQRFFFFCICRICIRRQRRKSKRLIAHTSKISHCHVVLSYSFSVKSGTL